MSAPAARVWRAAHGLCVECGEPWTGERGICTECQRVRNLKAVQRAMERRGTMGPCPRCGCSQIERRHQAAARLRRRSAA